MSPILCVCTRTHTHLRGVGAETDGLAEVDARHAAPQDDGLAGGFGGADGGVSASASPSTVRLAGVTAESPPAQPGTPHTHT